MVCTSQHDDDPSWWNDEDWLMAFDIGYDEGGSGDTLLISMQAGIIEQAKRLKRKWKSTLGPLEFFHSKELWNFSSGVFTRAQMSRDDRSQMVKDLAKLIHRHLSVGITARMSKTLYADCTTPEFRSRFGTAYSFMIYSMLLVYAQNESDEGRPQCEVNIIIEDGHPNVGQVMHILQGFKAGPPRVLPGLRIINYGLGAKKDHPILQAADMLVYAKQQEIIEGDRAIYDALYPIQKVYKRYDFTCDKATIQGVKDGADNWLKHRRDFGRRKHKGV